MNVSFHRLALALVPLVLSLAADSAFAQDARRPRRAVVLSGGGAAASVQVGMLKGLVQRRGFDFEIIRGTSSGAFNGAFLAQAPRDADSARSQAHLSSEVAHLEQVWLDLRGNRDLYRKRFLGSLGAGLFGSSSIYSPRPTDRLAKRELAVDAMIRSGRDFKISTTRLEDGAVEEWAPSAPDFFVRLRGSAAAPALFPPTRPTGDATPITLVDGGLRTFAPVKSALDAGADEVYVLLTHPIDPATGSTVEPTSHRKWRHASATALLARSVDILTDQVLRGDLRDAAERPGVRVYLLAPRTPFPGEPPSLNFDPEAIRAAMAQGYEVATREPLPLVRADSLTSR